MRIITSFALFVMLLPAGLMAQTILPAAPVPAQAVIDDPGGQTSSGYAGGIAPANLLSFSRDSLAIDDDVFSINQQRVGDEARSFRPGIALFETSECPSINLNYSSSSLLCLPINQLNRHNEGLGLGSSYGSGAAFLLGLDDSHSYLFGGVHPIPGELIMSGHGLLTDLNSKDYTPAAPTRTDTPNLDALPPSSEKHDDRAFLNVAPQSGSGRNVVRDKIALIVLSLAVHATVTWDAQSTNHFFHHYPEGFRPSELDPLMRPFAGKELMYPMANVLLAAPFDMLLFKTRHSHKPVRILGYAAASFWAGVEVHQSIVNMRNEHINSSR